MKNKQWQDTAQHNCNNRHINREELQRRREEEEEDDDDDDDDDYDEEPSYFTNLGYCRAGKRAVFFRTCIYFDGAVILNHLGGRGWYPDFFFFFFFF